MGVTVEDVLKWRPCDRYSRKVLTSLMGSRKSMSAVQVLELDIPVEDRLWAVFHNPLMTDREMHLLACDFAESVLALTGNDPRCAAAIATKRAFVDGEATEQDLAAARNAAWDAASAALDAARAAAWDAADAALDATLAAARNAAWDAASAAARSAAWDAASAAARDAAWATARDAARDAAWNAALAAAWDAARDAAWAAAWDAARDAAWDAARNAAWNAAWDAAWEESLNHTLFVVLSGVYRESVLSA